MESGGSDDRGVEEKRKKCFRRQMEDLPPRAEKYELGCVTGGKDVSAVHNRACFSITREKTRNLYQRNGRARGCGANTSVARIVSVPSRINSRNFSRQFRHPFF